MSLPVCRACRGPIDAQGRHVAKAEESAESLLREAADTIEVLLSLDSQMPTASEDVADAERLLEKLRKRVGT